MSDYRFGADYRLNIYPKEAMDCWGEIDIDKVEAVEIEWVDFIRKPDDKSRWFELFGTPERSARTSWHMLMCKHVDCDECPIKNGCAIATDIDCDDGEAALLEWLRGDA